MGQRLNVEIVVNSKTIANIYMHWSAYTSSSLRVTKEIIEAFNDIEEKDLENLNAIYKRIQFALENASVTKDEEKRLKEAGIKNIKAVKNVNRNDGLVAFTQKGIEDTRAWEEGRTTIDIQNKKVLFDVYYISDREEFDNEEDIESFESHSEKADKNPFENWLSYEEFNEVANDILHKIYDKIYNLKLPKNQVLSFIE